MRKESERTVRKGASETIGAEIGTTVGTEPWVGEEVPSVEESLQGLAHGSWGGVQR